MADTAQTLTADTINPHLKGVLAPVRQERDFEVTVRGRIPDGLNGALYRNGPNPQFDPSGPYHAFIGDGMIHGFWIADGKAHYRNRYVRTPRWLAENAAGRNLFGGMGMPSDPSVENIHAGGANTNVVHHANKLMALQEGSEPFELDAATLDPRGFGHTGGRFTAHPKMDPETGEMVWFAYSTGEQPLNNLVDYGVSDAAGNVVRRDRFAAPYCSMIHDFMVTQNHVLFPVLPLTGDLQRAMKGGPAFAWEPEKGAYIGVMKRDADVSTIRWFEIDAVYMFHPMNMWEDGTRIHADVMEYPSAPLFPNADGSRGDNAQARLVRWTLDLAGSSNKVTRTPLHETFGEFPRFDERRAGLRYRHGWYAANVGAKDQLTFNALAHVDHVTGRETLRQMPAGDQPGEPIFVPRTADAPEGDGWILSVIHRADDNTADLLVLNAQDIAGDPEAVLSIPARIPSGFHGNWVGA
jgi:carotenoid cleavage dioxygenase-like enzyme